MKKVELYKHNKTTYDNITRIFETRNRCAVVQPTGSGKSWLIMALAQDNPDKRIVVFEPNRYIISRVSEQMKEYGIENVVFYTYQKLNKMNKDDNIDIDTPDYICLDELHRTKSTEWNKAISALLIKFDNAKILGLTATPQRMDGTNVLEDFGGEIACEMRLGDAIVNKILPCPTYINALYTFDEEIQKVYEKIDESRNPNDEKEDLRKQLEAAKRQLETALGVPSIFAKHINANSKYLVFCQNIQHLNSMKPIVMNWFEKARFETHMYEVHTKNPDRETEYKAFTEDNAECVKLCICVDMFNEGVHLDGISGVILLRPTQSNILYLQQIGRALNAGGTQPIIFDLVNNSNCLGAASIKSEIESAIEKQKAESDGFRDNDVFDIDCFRVFDYVRDSLDVLRGIENRCFDEFDFRLKQLEEYKAKWGHCCVMKDESEEWEGLNDWAIHIRCKINKDNISQRKKDILNQHGFVWDLGQWRFEKIIEHIKQYNDEGNSLPIPCEYICKDGFKLGQQITHLKTLKEKKTLRKNFEKELINLGVNLEFKNFDEQWIKIYNIAYEYVVKLGNRLTYYTRYKGINIGHWVNRNRQYYKKNELTQDRVDLLKKICDLDFDWNKECDKQWNRNFMILQEYLSVCQTIKQRTEYKDVKIGLWLDTQIQLYEKNKLKSDRVEKIKSLKFIKSKYDKFSSWEELLRAINECNKNNVKINSYTIYDNIHIGARLKGHRSQYKKGKFPEERYQQLLSLGIDLAKEGGYMADPA